MYEKNGEKYFVFDSHLHFWDASPENWVKGAEEYAKGWIECFHAYQGLGPAETHWSLEHFQKYSVEDFEKDVFTNGHVDVAVFQSTYLKEWYTKGFNDIEQNAALLERFPGKLILNGRWDPREGEAGLEQLRADHAKYGIQGVKLYTAEWYKGSRGWKLTDPEAVPFLDLCVELGIKNIHVHKGPTIWPLDKDAFDVSDVDHVATDYNGKLNFIVEHVGLPRIEDFCFMATQEPNVYAGLVGGHRRPHARPPEVLRQGHGRAAVLGRRGQDAVRLRLRHLGAEVAGRGLRRLGDARRLRVRRLPAAGRRGQEEDPRAQRREALRRRRAGGAAAAGAGRGAGVARERRGSRRLSLRSLVYEALGTVYDPELDEPITTLGFVGSLVVTADGDVSVRLRLPTPQCAPNFAFLMAADARAAVLRVAGVRDVGVVLEDHYTGAEINAAVGSGAGFGAAFPGETRGELDALRVLFQRKALVARQGRLLVRSAARHPGRVGGAGRGALPRAAAGAGHRRERRRARVRDGRRRAGE